jgi:hypothetical protein
MPRRSSDALVASVCLGYGLGWSFTPLAGKRPILKGWQHRPRETLEQALAWAAQGNLGLRTGRTSGLVVIDLDEGGAVESLGLRPTVTVRTGGNGVHFYFHCKAPLGNSSGRLGPHIDVRADGGQVVFAGSVHPDTGRAYEWAQGRSPTEVGLADLPAHLLERLRSPPPASQAVPPPTKGPPEGSRSCRYAVRALEREASLLCGAQRGTRNDTLNKAAFRMGTLIGGGRLDRSLVEEALLDAASAIGLGRDEARATIGSGIGSGIRHPRQP